MIFFLNVLHHQKYIKSTERFNQESETHFSRGGHFKIVSLMKFKIVCKKIKYKINSQFLKHFSYLIENHKIQRYESRNSRVIELSGQ